METTNIYILIDPITEQVRYVGKANNVSQRYHAHLNKARKHQIHKVNWIKGLKEKGLKPIVVAIYFVPIKEWHYFEKFWIVQFKTWGFDLINYTLGGDGCTFGNQTSFKKGNIPWNAGTIKKRICIVCGKEFKPHSNSTKQKSCSYKCAASIRKSKTQFKNGNKPWNKNKRGYKLNAKSVIQMDLTGNYIKTFYSCKEAANEMNCSVDNIRNVCLNKAKTAKGFKWKYKNNNYE